MIRPQFSLSMSFQSWNGYQARPFRAMAVDICHLEGRVVLSSLAAVEAVDITPAEYEALVQKRYGGELNKDIVYDDAGNTQEVDVVTPEALIQAKRLTEKSFDKWPADRLPGDLKAQLERTLKAAEREGKKVIFVTPVAIPDPYKQLINDMGIDTEVVPIPETAEPPETPMPPETPEIPESLELNATSASVIGTNLHAEKVDSALRIWFVEDDDLMPTVWRNLDFVRGTS